MTELIVDVAPDAAQTAQRAAALICDMLCADDAVGAVCLAGGGTPRELYRLLAREPFRSRIPWARVHWFFGDERFVPPDDPRSNARMVREALFSQAPIPEAHVHQVPTVGLTLEDSADRYQKTLQDFYGTARLRRDRPLFDVVILGLGPDGHTASLLPGRREIDVTDRWVCAVGAGMPEPRITLTPPALESAHAITFVVTGAEKRAAFAKLRSGDQSIPATHVRPRTRLLAFVDA
ncbi:MAG TPA: 6-phosphogluconolactonase, partial [Beijerinckiaceae bacterium]|nr:6-phosphogluconolactonase [Beijerinckiaceae bacterium]